MEGWRDGGMERCYECRGRTNGRQVPLMSPGVVYNSVVQCDKSNIETDRHTSTARVFSLSYLQLPVFFNAPYFVRLSIIN